MPILTELNLFPIKSCAGIALQEAQLTQAGLASELVYDREWMIIDADGIALTQRTHPQMALIQPRIKADTLAVSMPGMLTLDLTLDLPDPASAPRREVVVWDNTILAFDCGDLCATWVSKALNTPCRLVRFHSEATRYAKPEWTGNVQAPALFADGFPLLLIGQSSLDDLNQKLQQVGRAPLPMDRFRTNLVISDYSAYEEDYIDELVCGEIRIKPVKPCSRCDLPAVAQDTGIVGPNPMDILSTYRANARLNGGISFGMNCIVLGGAGQTLRVGQVFDASLTF
jgi:uncharacterized protein